MKKRLVQQLQEHRDKCQSKLNILLEQRTDLSTAIDDLLGDIRVAISSWKYKQMKMYNDDELNLFCTKEKIIDKY
jgi:hypothetical protein